jgi:hypothetical protein
VESIQVTLSALRATLDRFKAILEGSLVSHYYGRLDRVP